MKKLFLVISLLLSLLAESREVNYTLNIDYKSVNFTGKTVQALAINGSIPAPTLEFTQGDVAVINVVNNTDDEASIHWHGLLLPQDQDGVPYLTMFPIEAGRTYQYRFALTHSGTYWYHSHTRIDEQKGQYGAIVVHPKNEYEEDFQHDVVVQLSDWTDEDPYDVLKNLKKDGDWYAYKKDSVISLQGYLEHSDLGTWFNNRWQRMEGMDVSDVGYDAYLANGKPFLQLAANAKAGDRIRVRLINSGASSIFTIEQYAAYFEIIAADGIDVKPKKVEKFQISMAETYDFIVTIPESGALEFAANNIDGTGGVKVKLGSGTAKPAPAAKKPNLFVAMDHSAHTKHVDHLTTTDNKHEASHKEHHHGMHHMPSSEAQQIEPVLDYKMLKVRQPVSYQGEVQKYTLELTGDMENYNWSFNNLALSKADVIKIDRGKVVQFHFINRTMMNHPLHLHGHFFKVLSGNGDHDVLKHTVNVPPMGEVTIEFEANAEKDWFFHCHNLYHAKAGMARVVRYSDYQGNPEYVKAKMRSNEIMDSDWYSRVDMSLLSNHGTAQLRFSNFDYVLQLNAERHFDEQESEYEMHFNVKQSRWLNYFVGLKREHEENEGLLGLKYILPFNIESAVWVNHKGKLTAAAETKFQLTKNIGFEFGASSDSEWEISLEYRNSPSWSIILNKNNISNFGVGFSATF